MNVDLSQLDVPSLVESLYAPGNSPEVVGDTQKTLQAVQKSPQGWQIADLLIEQPSFNCKFFGALTYTVKLNQQVKELVATEQWDQLRQLTTKLLQNTLRLVADDTVLNHGGLFVIKKMLANLSLVYMANQEHWMHPLATYIQSLLAGQPVFAQETPSSVQIAHVVGSNSLSVPLLRTVLLFSQIIAEELIKKELSNADQAGTHQQVHDNLFKTTEILLVQVSSPDLMGDWLACLGSWITYASKAEYGSVVRYNMAPLLDRAIDLMASGNPDALDTVADALDTNYTFFTQPVKEKLNSLIFGDWGRQFLQQSPEDAAQFARMVILYLEPDTLRLATRLCDSANDPKFAFLLQLTAFPGEPISEEGISNDFIDFWMQFTDAFVDDDERLELLLKKDDAKLAEFQAKSKELFVKISQIYWSKVHVPEDVDQFKEEFRVYRRDVGDLFESLFPVVKGPLYNDLINSVLANVNSATPNMDDIEASLYLLTAISADFSENNVQDDVLQDVSKILGSNYLQVVSAGKDPSRFQYIVHTTVRFLATIDWFYKSPAGLPYLPQILNFLFNTMVGSQHYQLLASKAIADICDNCRMSLQESLPSFKGIITEMINDVTVEPVTRQRIINSYASIIQGVKDPSIQGQYLHELFDLLANRSLEILSTIDTAAPGEGGEQQQMLEYLISLISCVSAIGKGMQLPDSPEEVYNPVELEAINQYWTQDPLNVRDQILQLINNFSKVSVKVSGNLRVAEEISSIFRSGMTETVAGPFVFSPQVIVEYIVSRFQTLPKTDTYPQLYDLYSSLIKAHHSDMIPETVGQTLQIIYGEHIPAIEGDPDLIQAVMNLYSTILITKPSLLVATGELFENVLSFAMGQLKSSERFVLRALEHFWTRLIYLRKGNRQDTVSVRRIFNETQLGYLLTFNVLKYMFAMQRSNLEFFTDILKALVAKYPMLVGKWLEQAFKEINQERAQTGKKPIEKYELFIKKILITRGTRAANALIKDFWLEVNELVDYGI